MSNFDPNAILRGAQLTVVGALRALQNPGIFTSEHYQQAALAVVAGIAIKLAISVPILIITWLLRFLSLFTKNSNWDDKVVDRLEFLSHSVLQLPFFFMTLMRYITPTLDELFMDSLNWVDQTYLQKHQSDDPQKLRAMYYPNLKMYSGRRASTSREQGASKHSTDAVVAFLVRYARKAGISLAVYLLSLLPVVGRFVLPAASFYTFNKAVGPKPALLIFGSTIIVPRRYLIMFLQSYFSSRSLMRDLLDPYFSRVRFSKEQKKRWFRDREGVLFGFGVGFFILLKLPLIGVLVYGIAEASTAYLITKITDPPPPPAEAEEYVSSQVEWKNKHKFLRLPLANLDDNNVDMTVKPQIREGHEIPGKKFS